MYHYESTWKWEEKLRLYLAGEKDFIPEISAKEFIKKNLNELLFDCHLCYKEEETFKEFFKNTCNHLINFAIFIRKKQDEVIRKCTLGNVKSLPGLDYYDNRRDQFFSNKLVPHQGQFGAWNDK